MHEIWADMLTLCYQTSPCCIIKQLDGESIRRQHVSACQTGCNEPATTDETKNGIELGLDL